MESLQKFGRVKRRLSAALLVAEISQDASEVSFGADSVMMQDRKRAKPSDECTPLVAYKDCPPQVKPTTNNQEGAVEEELGSDSDDSSSTVILHNDSMDTEDEPCAYCTAPHIAFCTNICAKNKSQQICNRPFCSLHGVRQGELKYKLIYFCLQCNLAARQEGVRDRSSRMAAGPPPPPAPLDWRRRFNVPSDHPYPMRY